MEDAKINSLSKQNINNSIITAKLILSISMALKNGIDVEEIRKTSKDLAKHYNIDENYYNECIISSLNLINNKDIFSKIILKNDILNIREPQTFSNWIIWNGEK